MQSRNQTASECEQKTSHELTALETKFDGKFLLIYDATTDCLKAPLVPKPVIRWDKQCVKLLCQFLCPQT